MQRFSLRSLLLLTSIAAVLIAVFLNIRGQPRQFYTLDEIIARYASDRSLSGALWEIHVAPDISGPFRSAGDDWTSHGPVQIPPGFGAHGWIDTGSDRRKFDHSGIPDVSYLIIRLENPDDQAGYLLMKRKDGSE